MRNLNSSVNSPGISDSIAFLEWKNQLGYFILFYHHKGHPFISMNSLMQSPAQHQN